MFRCDRLAAELAVAILFGAALLLAGCAGSSNVTSLAPSPIESATVPTSFQPPNPPAISFFGEFPDRDSVPFESRAGRSWAQHSACPEGADSDPTLDPTGKWMAFSSTRHARTADIYIKTIDGAAVTQVTADPASDIQPAISPDGKRIAFASDRRGNFDVWIVGVDGQGATQITDSPAPEVHPTWSPDGNRLAYCSLNPQSRQWELWLLDLRQPGTRKFIGYGLYPHWSPREELIVYQRARERGSRWFSIWTVRLVDGEPRFPTEVIASATQAYILPAFSPDGRQIVFCAITEAGLDGAGFADAASDLWAIGTDGSAPTRLTDGEARAFSPAWASDGRVYFTSRRTGTEAIWSIGPITGWAATRPAKEADSIREASLSWDSSSPAMRRPQAGP